MIPLSVVRAFALVFAALVLLVPFLLLGQAARHGHVYHWDRASASFLHSHEQSQEDSIPDRLADLTVEVSSRVTLLVGLLILAILVVLRRTRASLVLIATSVLILGVTPLLKEYFERSDLKYSFPSGHAARSAALATATMLIAWSTRIRWPVLILGVLLTGTIGVALVYEDWHLPSDVIGGWCLGVACAASAHRALSWAHFPKAS
jgi:undecaprenyl-diphosphatase